jgi:hypothetical protein
MKNMGNLVRRLPFLFPTLTRIYTDPDQKRSSEGTFAKKGSLSEFLSDFLVERSGSTGLSLAISCPSYGSSTGGTGGVGRLLG